MSKQKNNDMMKPDKVETALLDGGWGCCPLPLLRYARDGGGRRSAGYCE